MRNDLDREIREALTRLQERGSREAPSRLEQELVGRVRRRRARSLAVSALAVGLCVALVPAVTTMLRPSPTRDNQRVPSAGGGDSSTPTASPSSTASQVTSATHSCYSRRVGDGGVAGEGEGQIPTDWREKSVVFGPLGLVFGPLRLDYQRSFAWIPSDRFRPVDGTSDRYEGIAFYAIVAAGESVTISIPNDARDRLSIAPANQPKEGPGLALTDGVHTLTLEACAEKDTEFLEAFVVAGPQCAPVAVLSDSDDQLAQLSFGAGQCPE